MVIDKRYISEMRRNGFCISKAKEVEILAQFSTEPDDFHEWTEQDIYEQTRKILMNNSKY